MNFSDLAFWIDWFLRILQIVTFIGVILKVTYTKNYYCDNVSVEKIEPKDIDTLNSHFRFIKRYDYTKEQSYGDYFLLYPKNVDIVKLDFIDISYDEHMNEIEALRETSTKISNHTCIVIRTILPEGPPFFKVRWETSTGEIGEYDFTYNGFNGNVDSHSYKSNLTLKRKIKMILSLK
jgi:hypothetical protein